MGPFLLGVDVGTSGCKIAAFDENGRAIAQETRNYPVFHPRRGWAEQDPEDWWKAVCEGIRAVLRKGAIPPADLAGIGVGGQSWSAIPVSRDGRVLCNTPIWMDTRASDICGELSNEISPEEIFELCGNPLQPFYTLPKILWFKKHEPSVYRETYKILQSNSFIGLRLTGKFSQDISQGYGLQCFDMRRGIWDQAMCGRMGIDAGLLPDLSACDDVIGSVGREASLLTGLAEGTPVVAGGLDAACGALGAGAVKAGQTQEQGGQAGGMSCCIDRYAADRRLILSRHVVPGVWLLQGGTVGGAGVMNWFEREFGGAERAESKAAGKGSFLLLDEEASRVPPGSGGLVFLPYMAGERTPIWDIHAKGVFFGIDFSKTKAHFARASLEGVAFALKHNLETAREAGAEIHTLYAVGGAANSKLWMQIKADITGRTIRVSSSDTATALGAAILAGVGTGVFRDYGDARTKTLRVAKEYRPDPENSAVYAKGYDVYLRLYRQLRELMRDADRQEKGED